MGNLNSFIYLHKMTSSFNMHTHTAKNMDRIKMMNPYLDISQC